MFVTNSCSVMRDIGFFFFFNLGLFSLNFFGVQGRVAFWIKAFLYVFKKIKFRQANSHEYPNLTMHWHRKLWGWDIAIFRKSSLSFFRLPPWARGVGCSWGAWAQATNAHLQIWPRFYLLVSKVNFLIMASNILVLQTYVVPFNATQKSPF